MVVVILMSPVWLQKHYGFAPAITLQANSIATIMLCIGCLLAGLAADRFGASRTFIVGSLLLAVASWAFYHLAGASPQRLFLLYGTVGLCVGVVGAVPYVMVRAFPAEVRFTGISFSYNLSYAIFGGLTPIAVTMLMGVSPMAPALVCAGPVADGAGIRYLAASGADGADGDAGRGAAALTMAS